MQFGLVIWDTAHQKLSPGWAWTRPSTSLEIMPTLTLLKQGSIKDSRIKEIYFRNQTDFWKMEMTVLGPLRTHLRSNVHPSVAILLEDENDHKNLYF